MSEFIIAGHCMRCDGPCFEIRTVYKDNERRPGEPKQIGPPLSGSQRIAFILFDGSRADITLCAGCANGFAPEHYPELWRKILRSWLREISAKPEADRPLHDDWFHKQFANGLLSEMGRRHWTEIVENA